MLDLLGIAPDRRVSFAGAPAGTFYGNGLLGQRVIVVPAMDMVIARMGLNFLDDFDQVLSCVLHNEHFCISNQDDVRPKRDSLREEVLTCVPSDKSRLLILHATLRWSLSGVG